MARSDKKIFIERRQRLIAAQVMMAVDLPQPAGIWAKHMIEAAKLCPGIKVGEIIMAKRSGLKRARQMIDELLEELP